MKNLLNQSMVYAIGFIVSRLQVFLLLPILVVKLSPSDYGAYETLSSLLILINTLTVFNFDSGLSSLFQQQKLPHEKQELASTGFFFVLGWAILIGLVGYFYGAELGVFLLKDSSLNYKTLAQKSIFVGCIQGVSFYLNVCLRQKFQAIKYNILVTVQTLPTLLFIFFYSRFQMLSLQLIFNILIAVNFFALALAICLNLDLLKMRFIKHFLRSLLAVALPLLPFSFFAWGISLFDRIVISQLLGLDQVAIYSFANRISTIGSALQGPFQIAWPPYALKKMSKGFEHKMFPKVLIYVLTAGGLFVVLMSFLSPYIYHLLAPENYFPSAKFVGILSFCTLLNTLYYFPIITFLHHKKTWASTISFFIGAIINVELNLILIPKIGIAGSVYANLAGYSGLLISSFYMSQKMQRIQYPFHKVIGLLLGTLFLAFLPILLG